MHPSRDSLKHLALGELPESEARSISRHLDECSDCGREDGELSMIGAMREVRVSKTARYRENFAPAETFAADGDTLALFHGDDGGGVVLHDASGHNRHGRVYSAGGVPAVPR